MKKFFRLLSIIILSLSSFLFAGCISISSNFPDIYHSTEKAQINLSGAIPLSVNPSYSKYIDVGLKSESPFRYQANLTLMNIIPLKSVAVEIVEESKVIPCGTPFGVKIFTDGVMIIGLSNVKTEKGLCNPARISGLKKGDVINKVNNKDIKSNDELASIIEKSTGKPINVSVVRGNITFDTSIAPVKSIDDDSYKAGIWVRDSSAGIGTLTFYDSSKGTFSGLGHGICDIDTSELLPLSHGDIMEATINGINKGVRGSPGELRGCFIDCIPIGNLKANTETGVYGTLDHCPCKNKAINVAMKQQVKTGPAKVLTTISGETPEYYNINIDSINYNEINPTKNILISIIDKNLIDKTGGIVQGMSGSPIIQNGLLIGAITHVFINDPNKGFAIFAETMMTNSNNIFGIAHKNAS